MRTIKLALLYISLVGCSRETTNNKEDVMLNILNKEVKYIAIDSSELERSEIKSFDDLRGYTKDERKLACNLLTFKLINNSNKKYYFILNTNEIDFYGNENLFQKDNIHNNSSIYYLCYLINNKNIKDKEINTSSFYSSPNNLKSKNDSLNIYLNKFHKIEGKSFRNYYKDIYEELTMKYSFVIGPGEYKIFKRKLYLPIDNDKNYNLNLNFHSLLITQKYQYDFSLAISANKKDIWENLQDYQRKELKENGYEIFDGVVISNKIPLKMVRL